MTVDGIDVKEVYGIEQWNVSPAYASISNESEWTAGAALPFMVEGTAGLKTIKVTVMVSGTSRDEIWKKAEAFVAKLLRPCQIRLDGFEHCFYMFLKNATQTEISLNRYHKATLELTGYEYGDEVQIASSAKSITVINPGTLLTPAIIEITPVINLASLTITGLARDRYTGVDKPIVISNLINGSKIIINGETGIVTQGGVNKFSEVSLWDLPALKPGENTVTVDKDVQMAIRLKPIYF